MYWPIGAPRIYAAGNSKPPKDRVHELEDDAESHETTESSGSYLNGSTAAPDTAQDDEDASAGLLTASTPVTTGDKAVERDAQRRLSARALRILEDGSGDAINQAEKEHILGLRMSRSGHLFAVITATSMTIWQTKVKLLIPG